MRLRATFLPSSRSPAPAMALGLSPERLQPGTSMLPPPTCAPPSTPRGRTGPAPQSTGWRPCLRARLPTKSSRFRAVEAARQVIGGIEDDDHGSCRRAAAASDLRARASAQRCRRLTDRPGAGDRRPRRDPRRTRRRRPERARHRHAGIRLRSGPDRLARSAWLRVFGARRSSARQGQRRARQGCGDRRRRQRRRGAPPSRRACAVQRRTGSLSPSTSPRRAR